MIKRGKHTKNYTVVPNEIFKELNNGLSIGILTYLLSKPENWEATKQHLYNRFKEGRQRIDDCFNELIESGYIRKEEKRKEAGKFNGVSWVVMDTPDRLTENRQAVNGLSENRLTENGVLISTNNKVSTINNKVIDNKIIDFDILLKVLNKYTGRKFTVINKGVRSKYISRIKEGYTTEMVRNAIINACNVQTHKDNNCQYLTPEFFSRASTLDKYGVEVKKPTKAKSEYIPTV